MIKIPEASPLTASISGLTAGVLGSLIRLSYYALSDRGLSALIALVLGGVALALYVAFASGFGKFLRQPGWKPVLRWHLRALLFGVGFLGVYIPFVTWLMPLFAAD